MPCKSNFQHPITYSTPADQGSEPARSYASPHVKRLPGVQHTLTLWGALLTLWSPLLANSRPLAAKLHRYRLVDNYPKLPATLFSTLWYQTRCSSLALHRLISSRKQFCCLFPIEDSSGIQNKHTIRCSVGFSWAKMWH
jgi:hypothetical protein